MSHISYSSTVGSLIYAMVCMRIDLSQAVSMVSRYMHDFCRVIMPQANFSPKGREVDSTVQQSTIVVILVFEKDTTGK